VNALPTTEQRRLVRIIENVEAIFVANRKSKPKARNIYE